MACRLTSTVSYELYLINSRPILQIRTNAGRPPNHPSINQVMLLTLKSKRVTCVQAGRYDHTHHTYIQQRAGEPKTCHSSNHKAHSSTRVQTLIFQMTKKLWEKNQTPINRTTGTVLGGVIKEWKDHDPCWVRITRRNSKNLESCSRDYF